MLLHQNKHTLRTTAENVREVSSLMYERKDSSHLHFLEIAYLWLPADKYSVVALRITRHLSSKVRIANSFVRREKSTRTDDKSEHKG